MKQSRLFSTWLGLILGVCAALLLNVAVARVTESDLPIVYVNQVGGQDELVFDGASFALDSNGRVACQMPLFEEALGFVTIDGGALWIRPGRAQTLGRLVRAGIPRGAEPK